MSYNGKDDGEFAVKEGPLDTRPQDITPAAKALREQPVPDEAAQIEQAVPEVPEDLSVADTLEWVGGDKRRAQKALDSENEGGGARTTLVHELERLLKDETGAGIASGEA